MKNKHIILLVAVIAIFVLPLIASAQQCPDGSTDCWESTAGGGTEGTIGGGRGTVVTQIIKIKNPFNCAGVDPCTLPDFLRALINRVLMPVGSVVAALMVIWAGFLYVTARGNASQISRAHQALLWAVIGAAILLGAWVISEAIQTTVDQLRNP